MKTNVSCNPIVVERKYNWLHNVKHSLVKNWCLKRSHLVYFIASKIYHADIRINIALRCRDESEKDWGHAWVSKNGVPLWEPMRNIIRKSMIMIHDNGKTVYWLLISKNG